MTLLSANQNAYIFRANDKAYNYAPLSQFFRVKINI